MANTGQLDANQIWAYGPDSGTADQRAQDFAESLGRQIARGNPTERTMDITPDGKPKGQYKVFVYSLEPK